MICDSAFSPSYTAFLNLFSHLVLVTLLDVTFPTVPYYVWNCILPVPPGFIFITLLLSTKSFVIHIYLKDKVGQLKCIINIILMFINIIHIIIYNFLKIIKI